jgi:amino acid adenylation domain-containing protein
METALASRFLRSAERFPDRPALVVGVDVVSYAELHHRAVGLAATLLRQDSVGASKLTAVFGRRGVDTFAAILAVLLRGHGYVPLNPRYPAARNRGILARSGSEIIVVDPAFAEAAEAVIADMRRPPALIRADAVTDADEASLPRAIVPDDPAYLLFTSGSTGRPKGVLVTHANVHAFLEAIDARYDLEENDRFSQLFDLTFDLSVFDLFAAWGAGACLCCPADKQLLEPSSFLRAQGLTVWFSVPSVATLMHRLGALKPAAFPTLRLSLFCGEALPTDVANAWAEAAPNSVVENLYGPTEATIACTAQRWEPTTPTRANGVVPIGSALGETSVCIVDAALREVEAGQPGQLVLAGPQVVHGYLDDDEATAAAFVDIAGFGRGYLSGDRVVHSDGVLQYLGRMDSQIKIRGHRVELGEVEAALRHAAQADAVAVGWPRTASGAAGIVAFVADPSLDAVALRQALAERLPDYMIPRELHLVPALPLNANGKHDRQALLASLGPG